MVLSYKNDDDGWTTVTAYEDTSFQGSRAMSILVCLANKLWSLD